MKLVTTTSAPVSAFDLTYHRIGLLLGSYVYGAGFATGPGPFRLFAKLPRGTIWFWRLAFCRMHIDDISEHHRALFEGHNEHD